MAVSVQLPQFKGFGVDPSDITFGDGQSQSIAVLVNGRVQEVTFVRRSLTFRIKGIPAGSAISFIEQAKRSNIDQVVGSPIYEDISLGGYVLQRAILKKATPSAPIVFNGGAIMPLLELVYESDVFE